MTDAYITTEKPSGQLDVEYAHASQVTLHRVRSGAEQGTAAVMTDPLSSVYCHFWVAQQRTGNRHLRTETKTLLKLRSTVSPLLVFATNLLAVAEPSGVERKQSGEFTRSSRRGAPFGRSTKTDL